MNPVAAILDSIVLYRYSLILALASAAGICFFLSCCAHMQIPFQKASAAVLKAVILSLPLARLVYWYGRPDHFSSFIQVLSSPDTECFALAGVLAGCFLSAVIIGGPDCRKRMLDCMSVSGCFAIALGRLGSFFTDTDRGQIMTRFTALPWAYPVATVSGQLEYRFATFLFQAAAAALLGILLFTIFWRKRYRQGDLFLLFTLCYSASQVILDSTRYDSLYLRSNGFISMVQVFSAIALVAVLIILCIRTKKTLGFRGWMVPLWVSLAALFGCAGYMEYYVQRHGREAAFSYSIMGLCLLGLVGHGLMLWHLSNSHEQ